MVHATILVLLFAGAAFAQQAASEAAAGNSGAITEAGLKQLLAGKYLYLRGGYLDNSLTFNDRGELMGNSPKGSYTLNVIQIESVRLTSRKLELQGVRYALHFLSAEPTGDSAGAIDRVRITPRKKWVHIAIERIKVVKPPKPRKGERNPPAPPPPEQPDAPTTTSPAYAATLLRQAIGKIFASDLDERMMATLPAFWRTYYQDRSSDKLFQPAESGVLPLSAIDRQPRLLTPLDAPSNQYAQSHSIAGIALYRAVIGADGAPEEITVARPIGFGLDENAVAAIGKARFDPAMKDGKPVPVLLDLVVEFRIYSKRTGVAAPTAAGAPSTAPLPGPYTAEHQ